MRPGNKLKWGRINNNVLLRLVNIHKVSTDNTLRLDTRVNTKRHLRLQWVNKILKIHKMVVSLVNQTSFNRAKFPLL